MNVNFPLECNNEASRWSFAVKLNEKLRIYHNNECVGLSSQEAETWRKTHFYPELQAVMSARNEQIAIAQIGGHWNPRVPDHVSGGVINYPPGLDQNNEGSRAVFLFGLMAKLQDRVPEDVDAIAVQAGISQAKQDAINGNYWNPSLEDIT